MTTSRKAIVAVGGFAVLVFGALGAHATTVTPAADTGDHLLPNNSVSIGSAAATTLGYPAGVTNSPMIKCSHNVAALKTPNTRGGATFPVSLQMLPPVFDRGPAGAMTPSQCIDQFAQQYTIVTAGHWVAKLFDCPSATASCLESAEPNTDTLVISIPQNGMVITGNGCIVYVNHNSATPFSFTPAYTDGNGQLAVNVRSSTTGIPATVVQQTGATTCGFPTFSSQTCSGQSDAVCLSYVGTYTFGGTSGFPKLSDN